MTDNASEIDVTARSTIGTSTATNQISSRAKKLGQLVEKGLSGLGENQIKGFLNNALLEIEGSLSDFEKDYDGELLRLERLLSSRKGKVTKALSAGLVKVQYGKGQDYYAVDYAQMYNAFFEKVLKIVKATKSQGSSAILGQIQEHIHEMIGNDSLTDDDKALMNKLIQEMQALQKERAKIKVVEVGTPPEQKVTVEVKQEVKQLTQEEVVAAVKEKQAAGVPAVESQSLHTATIKKLEADVARLQKEMEDADKKAAALFDAMDAGDSTISQSVADAAEEDYQKKTFLWKKAQQDLENEKAALKQEGIGGKQQLTAEDVAEFRKKQKDVTAEATTTPRSKPDKRPSKQPRSGGGKQVPSEDDADYVKSARERIKVLDDAYDQFLGMQSMWMSGIEQSITDMLDGVRLASQEMVFVITAEIQKNIGGKLKTIGKQIEESFGAKSTSGVASIAGKLDTINTTLLEIKNGLVRQKYIQDIKSVPKSAEDEAPQKAIAEIIGDALNHELAPILGEVLGEQSDLNWQKYLNLEGDVRKPIIDRILGFNKGGIVPGSGDQDSVLGKLTPGEWIINPRRLVTGTLKLADLDFLTDGGLLDEDEGREEYLRLVNEGYQDLGNVIKSAHFDNIINSKILKVIDHPLDYTDKMFVPDISEFEKWSSALYDNFSTMQTPGWGIGGGFTKSVGRALERIKNLIPYGNFESDELFKPSGITQDFLRKGGFGVLPQDKYSHVYDEISIFDKHIEDTSEQTVAALNGMTLIRGVDIAAAGGKQLSKSGGIIPPDKAYQFWSLIPGVSQEFSSRLLRMKVDQNLLDRIAYISPHEAEFITARDLGVVFGKTDKDDAISWVMGYPKPETILSSKAELVTSKEYEILTGSVTDSWKKAFRDRYDEIIYNLGQSEIITSIFPKMFAAGGPLMPGQTAVVGEEGPEMLVPAGRGFHVLNNKIFRAMGGMRFLKRGTVKAEQEQEQEPPFKASGVKWAPRYVMDIAGDIGDGIAYATAESLKDVISSEVGPEFRTAAGGFAKRINDATFDIAKGTSIGGVSSRAADAVDLLRLKGGKAAEMVGRFAASARYAVTGGLIFAHVLRMLTATSQIYQKGMQAVGRGWGYMLDMILLPILPAFLLVARGFIAIGNFFRANPLVAGITAIGLFTAAITAAVYAVWKIKQDMERAAAAFERFSAAMEGREYIPPEVKQGFLSRIFGGVRNFGGSVFGRLFRKTPPQEPSGGGGTGSPEPKPEYRYGPIEQPSGQYPIPYEWGYRPRKTYEVGRHRAGGNYAEAYPTSPGNWATTYDENGNPVINKVYRVKRRIRHFLTGGLVGETGPAILHTGELVIPANVVRGGLPKFADGGVFGGGGTFSDFIGPIAAQFAGITAGGAASFLTNPAVQSVLSGMRVVSATIGSVLAPIALIGGGLGAAIGMAQKGIGVLGRVFSKGTEIQVETAVNVGRAQRNLLTLMNLQLMAVVGGIVALLAAIAAIKGPGEVGFDVAKLAAGLVNGLLQKWGQFVDDLIKGSSKFIDDFVKALIGKESFLTKLFERLFGKEAGFVPALIEKLIGKESFLGKFVDDLLKGAGSLTDEIIKKLIGEEGGFVSKIVEKLVGSEGGFIPKLIEKVVSGGGKVAEVVGGITSKAGSILGKAGEFLGLGKGAPFYAKGIKPTIGYIVGDLIGGVLAQGAGAGAADSGYTGGMTGFRPDLAQGSTTTFGAGSAEFLMNFFPKLWPALSAFNLVGQYQYGKEQAEGRLPGDMSYGEYKEYRINVTAEKLAEWWDSTATSIKAVFDGMAGWWNTTWNGFTSAVSASIDGVISTITGMVDGITAAWNSVVSALTSFFTLDNLKQIVMGAVTGAGSTVSGVVGTVGGIVGDLIHFDNGGITTKEGIGMLHAAEAIVPLSSTSIGSTTNRSEQRSMQVTNYNTFEVKREDDFLLFQRFQQFMANEQRRYTL